MRSSSWLSARDKIAALAQSAQLFRTSEWVGITVHPLCISFYYLLLIHPPPYWPYLGGFALVIAFVLSCGAFAFALNTLCDLSQDAKSGKRYALSTWSRTHTLLLLGALSAVTLLTAVLLGRFDRSLLGLAAVEYAMSVAYSMPRIRLKEHPILGPLTIGLSQFAIPQLMVFSIFSRFSADTFLFGALFLVVGLRAIIFHQILDCANDMNAGVVTFVTRFGVARTWQALIRLLVPLELGLLVATLIAIETHIPGMLAYTAVVLAAYWMVCHVGAPIQTLMSVSSTFLIEYYLLFWPLYLLLYGAWHHWIFLALLVLHVTATASTWGPYGQHARDFFQRLAGR